MKRKRPILYEVFGPDGHLRGLEPKAVPASDRPPPERPKRSRGGPLQELRVSYELAAVLGLLVVVLAGTLYYFGTVRGRVTDDTGSLSTTESSFPGPEAPKAGPGASGTDIEEFYAVRVLTSERWVTDGPRDNVEEATLEVCDFLEEQGFPDVQAVLDEKNRCFAVFVGRAQSQSELQGLHRQLSRVEYRGRRFDKPFISWVKLE